MQLDLDIPTEGKVEPETQRWAAKSGNNNSRLVRTSNWKKKKKKEGNNQEAFTGLRCGWKRSKTLGKNTKQVGPPHIVKSIDFILKYCEILLLLTKRNNIQGLQDKIKDMPRWQLQAYFQCFDLCMSFSGICKRSSIVPSLINSFFRWEHNPKHCACNNKHRPAICTIDWIKRKRKETCRTSKPVFFHLTFTWTDLTEK